jgi:transcriptional regulator with XRE-family HTH domain
VNVGCWRDVVKNNIKILRLKKRWTQKELSVHTKEIDQAGKGLTQSTISDLEKYHFTVKGRNLKLLMIVFEVDKDEILI